MDKMMMRGAAIALFSALLGVSGGAAAVPGGPGSPCSESNWGEVATVERYNPRTGYTQWIYECTPYGWTTVAHCNANGCTYY